MIELRRNPHGDRKVEVADPYAVHAVERGDRLDVLDPFGRLDLGEDTTSLLAARSAGAAGRCR